MPPPSRQTVKLGAERLLAAQRDSEKIAVEVKSFTNPSAISEFIRLLVNILTIDGHCDRKNQPESCT